MNKTIKGFAGAQTNNPKTGALHWQWSDDSGIMHTFKIPNSYYVPECELQLLTPLNIGLKPDLTPNEQPHAISPHQ